MVHVASWVRLLLPVEGEVDGLDPLDERWDPSQRWRLPVGRASAGPFRLGVGRIEFGFWDWTRVVVPILRETNGLEPLEQGRSTDQRRRVNRVSKFGFRDWLRVIEYVWSEVD